MSRTDVRRRLTEMAADAETDAERRQVAHELERMDEEDARLLRAQEKHQALVSSLRGAARRAGELHAPRQNERGGLIECVGCDHSGWESEPPEWPCRTIGVLR